MGKELTPKRMKELNDIKIQNMEIYNIVLGYNGHLRYSFEELKTKLKEVVEFYVDQDYRELNERDTSRDFQELWRAREDIDTLSDISYWDDLEEVYRIVYNDIDAWHRNDFKSLKAILRKHFPTDNLDSELADLEEYRKKLKREREQKDD
jgi:hypothetical protein